MTARSLYLDRAPGETRGVVMLGDRPERLLIGRIDDIPVQQHGARVISRVRRIEKSLASAFLDVGQGTDAILGLKGLPRLPAEGAFLEIEIVAEARGDKGAVARLIDAAKGPVRLAAAAPSLVERLQAFAPGQSMTEGELARDFADEAEAAVLDVEHALPGGGSIAIETTRALAAIDVDLGARGGDARGAARQVNLTAIAEAARLLRLKAIGGLIVFDLVGAGHDGPALAEAAKSAFAPDGPGVSIGPVSRFGLLQLATPRRGRPLFERLCGLDGRPTAATRALHLLRALAREGRADGGARLIGVCAPDVALAAEPYISALIDQVGRRFEIRPDPAFANRQFQVEIR